jgi:SAM-dependent methyltransferase
MAQINEWEREYKNPVFLTKDSKPQKDTIRFAKFLKKKGVDFDESVLIDLGSGTGRNGNYFAEEGTHSYGIELSQTAVDLANKRAGDLMLPCEYIQGDMGSKLPFNDDKFDIALDVMSSNSLDAEGRKIFVSELHRTLKPGGYVYIKALCKEGNKNTKELLKKFPGNEVDTYKMPETDITETVFDEQSFKEAYTKKFEIIKLEKKTNYIKFGNQSFKRNYWICYMQKTQL